MLKIAHGESANKACSSLHPYLEPKNFQAKELQDCLKILCTPSSLAMVLVTGNSWGSWAVVSNMMMVCSRPPHHLKGVGESHPASSHLTSFPVWETIMKYILGQPTSVAMGTVLVDAFCLLSLCTQTSTDQLKCSGNFGEMRRKKLVTQGASSGKSFAKCKGCGRRMICPGLRSHQFIFICVDLFVRWAETEC